MIFQKKKTTRALKIHNAFFRNKRFVLNEMFHRNASKLSTFSFHATFGFMNSLIRAFKREKVPR